MADRHGPCTKLHWGYRCTQEDGHSGICHLDPEGCICGLTVGWLAPAEPYGVPASEYLAKIEADPRRAAALQRARERAAGVLADAPAEQWPRDLSEAEMDELATALNEHDAGSIGFHGLVDRVLAVVRRTSGVKVTP